MSENEEEPKVIATFEIPAIISTEHVLMALTRIGYDGNHESVMNFLQRIDNVMQKIDDENDGEISEDRYTILYSSTFGGAIGMLLRGADSEAEAMQWQNATLVARNEALARELKELKGEQ